MEIDKIIVVKRDGKIISDTPEIINVKDILKTEPQRIKGNDRTIITTTNGEYIYCTSNDHVVALISKKDGFEITDRGRIANLNNDISIDSDKKILTFNNYAGMFVTIAKSKLDYIKMCVDKILIKK